MHEKFNGDPGRKKTEINKRHPINIYRCAKFCGCSKGGKKTTGVKEVAALYKTAISQSIHSVCLRLAASGLKFGVNLERNSIKNYKVLHKERPALVLRHRGAQANVVFVSESV